MAPKQEFDSIGYWSEIKLDIVRKYAHAYSTILSSRRDPGFHHVYVDGFAGSGMHLSRMTGEFVLGSPLNALLVEPPFKEFHLVDLDGAKAKQLRESVKDRQNVYVYERDCNEVLLEEVFPKIQYADYRRGLCLLDPYGLHLEWSVIEAAGQMKSLEIFLNFPVMDMNMNVLWHNSAEVSPQQQQRMDTFWGDRSWHDVAYTREQDLFNVVERKADNEVIAKAFGDRLRKKAGFAYVSEMPMRNSRGSAVYYLYFASHKPVAAEIVGDIFSKYRDRGAGRGK